MGLDPPESQDKLKLELQQANLAKEKAVANEVTGRNLGDGGRAV
jgi:hypothetical protein